MMKLSSPIRSIFAAQKSFSIFSNSPFKMFSTKDSEVKAKPETIPLASNPETQKDFLSPAFFYRHLQKSGLNFYTGVPDSLLSDFCSYVSENSSQEHHVIASNQGAAIALAAGYHLATRKFPVVYLQNSGIGNCINPLLSLTDSRIYSIPMLILVGWRGEPGRKDEPQHMVTGKLMSSLLTACKLNYEVLPDYQEGAEEVIESAIHHMQTRQSPYVLLVKRQTFQPYKLTKMIKQFEMNRRDALNVVLDFYKKNQIFVSTTGFTSREVYELRIERGQDHSRDFMCVGSMGHASSIALGIAMKKPTRNIVCLDGDGALLMHMGAMSTIGSIKPINLTHIVINNESHESVGGQDTATSSMNLKKLAQSCNYSKAWRVETKQQLENALQESDSVKGPHFIEIMTKMETHKNLMRPQTTPVQNKNLFMNYIKDSRVLTKVGDNI